MRGHVQVSRVLDRAIGVYIALCFGVYLVFRISPLLSLIADTPLYRSQAILGVIGGLLLLAVLVVDRSFFKAKYFWLLIGIVVFAGFGAIRTIDYGIKDNLFNLCWAAIAFTLFYGYAHRVGIGRTFSLLNKSYAVIFPIWVISALISIPSYFFQLGYSQLIGPDPLVNWTRQGFQGSRLFGVFTGMNQTAFISVMLLFASVYYLYTSRHILVKILIALGMLIVFIEQVLSGSRASQVALFFSSFVLVCYVAYRSFSRSRSRLFRWPVSLVAGVVAVVVLSGLWSGTYSVMKLVPNKAFNPTTAAAYEDLVKSTANGLGFELRINRESDDFEDLDQALEMGEDTLVRADATGEDFSNNRFQIWGDYLSLWKEIGFIGFSPENYDSAVRAINSDLYIVAEIDKNYQGVASTGEIYHPHNAYLMVYVAAGIFGFALLCAYLILTLIMVIQYVRRKHTLDLRFGVILAIILSSLLFCLFDQGLFFMNSFATCLFWVLAGVLTEIMRKQPSEDDAIPAELTMAAGE